MISFECVSGLPLEFESFLVEKYDSYKTTCRYLEVYFPTCDINHMLVFDDDEFVELLIFANRGDTTTCFNLFADFDHHIVTKFTRLLFEKYPAIRRVKFNASYKDLDLKKSFLFSKSNDYIVNLPATVDDYYSQLGSTTRKHIKNYKSRLLRDYPQANFRLISGADIQDDVIDRIIQLNVERMKYKGIVPGLNSEENDKIHAFSQFYGRVAYIEIDGNIVAGCIAYVLNKRLFLHIIAHDNNHSKYNVGQLCLFFLIQSSIESQLSTFHFLWGDNEYKMRFGAKPHALYSYFVYRSYSVDYIINNAKNLLIRTFIRFRNSKYSKPIRDAVKGYRRRKLNMSVS
jgi:hypothetical protein